ncbi:DoxX family protein [uncultured Rothia sp.]|uniref:DoxX family protein n=1 Tax=uncultured Rothia sp. TaxID=316088 RepID=UPI0032180271
MSLVRKLARPLLASSFVLSGIDRLKNAEDFSHLKKAIDVAAKSNPQLSALKGQEKLLGQGLAGAQVLAGSLFALGKLPRFSSLVLLATGATNAYVEYAATEATTAEAKKARTRSALTHGSLLGAIAITAVDTDGNPSLAWRANKFGNKVAKKSSQITSDIKEKSEDIIKH